MLHNYYVQRDVVEVEWLNCGSKKSTCRVGQEGKVLAVIILISTLVADTRFLNFNILCMILANLLL